MRTHHVAVALALAATFAFACSKSENKAPTPTSAHEPEPASATTAFSGKIDMDKAQVIFNERCAACHGTEGKGNGPASAALNPSRATTRTRPGSRP
jgi:mono/diheme cytochrome c family protein